MPDPRTGERVCACVVPADPSDAPSLAELVAHLIRHEVSCRKLPERLEIVAELPMTASGKVQKRLLRARLGR
ncbi:MAG: AMP-binding enzyme [Candidatus Binatia bacterium]